MPQYGSPDGSIGLGFAGTSFTPTLGNGQANEIAQSGAIYKNGMSQQDITFNRMLRQNKNIAQRELLRALIGVAPGGGTASAGRFLIIGDALFGNFSVGVEQIGVRAEISRATNANDQTNFSVMFNGGRAPAPYVEDSSGNGGGGKLGV